MAEFVVCEFGVLSSNELVLCGTEFESGGAHAWCAGGAHRLPVKAASGQGAERSEEG